MRYLILIFVLLSPCSATIRVSSKEATAFCTMHADEDDKLTVRFQVKLGSDPVGQLSAIDIDAYEQTPMSIQTVACDVDFEPTEGVYYVVSSKDTTIPNGLDNDDNLCGMKNYAEDGFMVYEMMFIHQIQHNGFTDVIDDLDRVYRVKCTKDNTQTNVVTTNIVVTTPNLEVSIPISQLMVTMDLWRKSGDDYVKVEDSEEVPAGTTVFLQIELERGADYNVGVDVAGLYAYKTEAGYDEQLNPSDFLVDENGCSNSGSVMTRAPNVPVFGFKGMSSGTKYLLQTGEFTLWKYKGHDQVYFKTYYGTCFSQSAAYCRNMCFAETGQEGDVKKRSTEEEKDYGITFTSVRVSGSREQDLKDPKTSESSTSLSTVVALGSVLGALVVMILVVMVIMVAVLRRRREQTKSRFRFENMSNASSTLPSKM